MKNINLHKVDLPEIIKENFDWLSEKSDKSINKSKQLFRFLFYLFRDSTELLEMSILEKPELSLQKKWFNYGLNSITEFCRLAHFEREEREAIIDNEGSFVIKAEELSELKGVRMPIYLARISREKLKEKYIAGHPEQLLNLDRNLTYSHEYMNMLTRLEIEYSLTGNFNNNYYTQLVEIYNKHKYSIQAKISTTTNHSLYYTHPYVVAFKSIVENDESSFNTNLITALEAHKEVWSQKKALNRGGTPLCRENEGFLSWGCTALAAMAFDKGWNMEVESDYMPQFMVDGSINK